MRSITIAAMPPCGSAEGEEPTTDVKRQVGASDRLKSQTDTQRDKLKHHTSHVWRRVRTKDAPPQTCARMERSLFALGLVRGLN